MIKEEDISKGEYFIYDNYYALMCVNVYTNDIF